MPRPIPGTIARTVVATASLVTLNACADSSTAPLTPDLSPSASLSAAATTYSGQAYALQVRSPSLGINQRVSDTGPLPSGGGSLRNAVVAFSIPALLQLEILAASTRGANGTAQAQAKVNRTKLFVGPNTILIEVVEAFAKAQCVGGSPVKSGSTVIVSLIVNGQGITITGQPNQNVPLPGGGLLTINEQTVTANSIAVNGLRVRERNGGALNVIVSHAEAGITC